MQKVRNLLFSAGAAIATRTLLQTISSLDIDGMLRPIGLSQRRRRWPENLAFLGAGIVVGGVTALLLAPASGAETRARVAKTAGNLSEAAAEEVRRAARELRDETNVARSSVGNGEAAPARGSA